MGTHPIFESDFDCLTEMGAIGIFEFGTERHEIQLNVIAQRQANVRVRNRVRTWVGTFQPVYIEQLTRKTGAFRSFVEFCQLLKGAIQAQSASVSLELLTPADLDALRVNKGRQQTTTVSNGQDSRRYLLLVVNDPTFNTRVHYPLSLSEEIQPIVQQHVPQPPSAPQSASQDSVEIQTIVRQLQEEIRRLQHPDANGIGGVTFREKFEEMVLLNSQLKRELDEANKTISNAKSVKMNKQMKKMVDHMEKALSDEKTRSRRQINEQKQTIRTLEKELTQTRTESKHLEIRNRALTTELATYKRAKRPGRSTSREHHPQPRVSALRRTVSSRGTSSERQSTQRRQGPPAYSRPTSSSRTRSRDPSPAGSIRSVASSCGSMRSCSSRASSTRSARSTASRGSRGPRFDPTAYVRAKKMKEDEALSRLKGHVPKKQQQQTLRHSRNTTKSSRSNNVRASTPVMTSDDESDFDLHNKYGLKAGGDSGSKEEPGVDDSLIHQGSFNINEIDARLSALQQYMDDLIVN